MARVTLHAATLVIPSSLRLVLRASCASMLVALAPACSETHVAIDAPPQIQPGSQAPPGIAAPTSSAAGSSAPTADAGDAGRAHALAAASASASASPIASTAPGDPGCSDGMA